jgi:hypothetical protein
MRSNLGQRRILLLLALLVLTTSGCTLRNFFGWVADSTYSSPVERQEVEDSMNEHWGKE